MPDIDPKNPQTWPPPASFSGPSPEFESRWNNNIGSIGLKFIEALALIQAEVTKIDASGPVGYFTIQTPQGEFSLQAHSVCDHEDIAKLAQKDRMAQISEIIEDFKSSYPETERRDIFYSWIYDKVKARKNFTPVNNPTLDGLIHSITIAFLRNEGFSIHS